MKIRNIRLDSMSVLFFLFTILACKNDQVISDVNQVQMNQPVVTGSSVTTTETKDLPEIPTPCALITPEDVKKIFNIKPNVGMIDISSGLKPDTKTCNFYWNNEKEISSNIIIEIQQHTQGVDMGASPTKYIEELISVGMEIRGISERIPFIAFDAAGKQGAYSFKQGRFFWAANDTYKFMVVVNIVGAEEKDISSAVAKLAEILNENLDKL